jgi:hypothetical protein
MRSVEEHKSKAGVGTTWFQIGKRNDLRQQTLRRLPSSSTGLSMQRAMPAAIQRAHRPFAARAFPSRNSCVSSRHDQHCLAIAPYFVVRSLHTVPEPKRVRPVLSDAQRPTIYALSTPPGKAGVAVIRVSGPAALDVWSQLVKCRKRLPEPWKMDRCQIVQPETGEILDDGLAVFFKGRRTNAVRSIFYG